MMLLIIQAVLEVPRSWPMDAAQDLQARAKCIHTN